MIPYPLGLCAGGVITVLSGMSSIQQMSDNLNHMSSFEPISEEERTIIAKSIEIIEAVPTISCTKYKYCIAGCPPEAI